ncbi:MAG: YbhB/YbcL family Raf kinase inhibitor-like protein [Pseudomonadota bacterium]
MILRNLYLPLLISLLFFPLGVTSANAFSLSFAWGSIPKCTSGKPNRVSNPQFKLSGVPEGTTKIKFKMVDRNVPSYRHGGGTVKFSGQKTISPGAFKYKSPCPPSGRHTYEWTATAIGKGNKNLGVAKSSKKYP